MFADIADQYLSHDILFERFPFLSGVVGGNVVEFGGNVHVSILDGNVAHGNKKMDFSTVFPGIDATEHVRELILLDLGGRACQNVGAGRVRPRVS